MYLHIISTKIWVVVTIYINTYSCEKPDWPRNNYFSWSFFFGLPFLKNLPPSHLVSWLLYCYIDCSVFSKVFFSFSCLCSSKSIILTFLVLTYSYLGCPCHLKIKTKHLQLCHLEFNLLSFRNSAVENHTSQQVTTRHLWHAVGLCTIYCFGGLVQGIKPIYVCFLCP